jgi:peptidoglycan/xylan/chitin deacetylase (PgdA/CDA1 family)
MPAKLCSINVDLDEIPNYWAIHGRAGTATEGATTVYDVALPRLCTLARSLDVPLTFFAVGEDVARDVSASTLRNAVTAGHGVGNHSLSHHYDLTRRPLDEIAREIDEGATAIERATGVRPRGFRAPGYTITDEVFGVLHGLGFAYDSSVFPCPAYMAAKDAAIASYALLGRPSRSVVDTPAVLTAPTRPYRVGKPYWRRGKGLLELPIQVTRGLRLPYIGTFLMMGGVSGARFLTRGVLGEPLVNLELHGIDVLDAQDEGLSALAAHQRDLKVTVAQKLEILGEVVRMLRADGYAFVTLDEAAKQAA